ncbi:MAG TPA: chromophore lyase CpcT/CpeT [Gemmatales bacterium]|nr:chromophore lyase CpcT/CpeT [Gemmatales bacterium]
MIQPAHDSDLQQLAAWMQGSFSSKEQARQDPEYLDVRLEMKRIWPEQQPGIWLYVEQAMANSLDKPYRQRIYRLTRQGDKLRSSVYTLPGDPLVYAGSIQNPAKLNDLQPDKLQEKKGCHILLTKQKDGSYEGSTEGTGCPSELRGASYATSKVKVTAEGLETWDQGYNSSNAQVWGATKGPYQFKRVRK